MMGLVLFSIVVLHAHFLDFAVNVATLSPLLGRPLCVKVAFTSPSLASPRSTFAMNFPVGVQKSRSEFIPVLMLRQERSAAQQNEEKGENKEIGFAFQHC